MNSETSMLNYSMYAKLILLFLCTVTALGVSGQSRLVCEEGQVKFTSNAPLEIIKASSGGLRGVIDTEKGTFAYSLPVRSFKGFNSPLQQEHFYENYLHTSQFQQASFHGKIIEEIDFSEEGLHVVRAKGILDIHGQKQERIIPCEIRIDGLQVLVTSTFFVPLKDHNISIPKIVHQKIAEEIQVEINAKFTK